jgi:predicted SpoU family rRNA methylase
MRRTLLSTLVLLTLSSISACDFYVPSASDHAKANAIASHISSKYGRFEQRSEVDKTHYGKTFYIRSGRYPELQFYEIINAKEMAEIEASAKSALMTAGVDRVRLVFFEKQNLTCNRTAECSRGKENIIKEILIGLE